MAKRYEARWSTEPERRLYNGANAAIEDIVKREVVCFASPKSMAERIAQSLNLTARFSDEELRRIDAALA